MASFSSEPLLNLPNDLLPKRKNWLDGVVSVYAQRSGISLASPGAGGTSGGGAGAIINNEEFLKFQSDQQKFTAQISVVEALSWFSAILVNKICKIMKIFEQLDHIRSRWVFCQH